MIQVTLEFGNGSLEKGCEHIKVEIRNSDKNLLAEDSGSLPPSTQLWELYQSWRESFRNRFGGRIKISAKSASSSSVVKQDLSEYIARFPRELNQWLNCEGFRPIEKLLQTKLNSDSDVEFSLTIKTEDNQLRRLPWYLWEFLEDYSHAEPALAFSKYESGKIGQSQRDRVRILVVIGDSQGIDTETDQKLVRESLEDAEIKILSQPSRRQLDETLWDDEGWDILAFLGHSESAADGNTGSIKINPHESLSLGELKYALSKAIKKGLQLAIFNSCDGLGLVRDLRDLYLPQVIVMREPVPDKIAQEFLKNFLTAFKSGKSLSLAVREGRVKLQKWEGSYPCATWLPVLCQNPEVQSINWVHLGGKPACPYRGLFAFREKDADIFYGREAVGEELYQRVESRQTLVAVVGASGSGKSSVVFAGLIPRLRQDKGVKIVNFRPGKNPFESLATALVTLWYEANNPGCDFANLSSDERRFQELDLLINKLKEKRGLCEVIETIVRGNLSPNLSPPPISPPTRGHQLSLSFQERFREVGEAFNSPSSLVGKGAGVKSSGRLVLVADQFEELYTLLPQSEQKTCELFLDSLLNAVNDSPAFTLVLTLRADFFHHAIKDRQFADALKNTNYPLGPMNRQELERAIRLPAEKRGVKLEESLLGNLLDDVGEKAENLPLLEFALTQLWKKQESGWLTRAAYKEIGGLQQSLARHAEDIYTHLNLEQRQRMQRVFIQLVRPGEGAADTRNVVDKSELQALDWDLITFLNREDARLVVINYDPHLGSTVEIVHEALISGWGRLNRWMGTHRQFRTWQERLKIGLKNWQEKDKDDGYLLSGGALGEAQEWLNSQEHREYLSNSQQEYIQLSLAAREKEEAERERQRQEKVRLQKRAIRWLGGGLLAATVATGFAGFNWMQADISVTRERLNSLVATSENYLNMQNYRDALFEAMKAQQLLDNTLWKQWLSTYIKQKIQIAIDRPTNLFIGAKHTLEGHTDKVHSLVYSPDGHTLATTSSDKTVKLWHAETGRLLHSLEGHTSLVKSAVYSPDGNTLASASFDRTVKLWHAENGQLLRTLEGHTSGINGVVYSPDGHTLATGSLDKTIKLWHAENGQLLHSLEVHSNLVKSVVYSPDGHTLAAPSTFGRFILWNAENGKLLHSLKVRTGWVKSMIFSPDGHTLATASDLGSVILWNAENGRLLHTLEGHTSAINSVVYSPDGHTLATASSDSTVKLWNAENGGLLHTLEGHTEELKSVVYSPDGHTLATTSNDNTVKLWNAENGGLLHTLEGHTRMISSVAYSPDGNTLATASWDKTVKLWNWNFNDLQRRGCNKLKSYLVERPEKLSELEVCQNQEILTAAASTLVEEGEELAKDGNFKGAVEKFRQAKKWNLSLDINPKAKAATAFITQGRELAEDGKFKEAVEKFTEAQRFDNNVDLNPRTKELDNDPKVAAGKLVAKYFVTQGRQLAEDGKLKEAIAAYNKALEFNRNLQISADDWRSLCWYGSLYNHAQDVMFACNKAVAKAPQDGVIRNNRGLARSLTGDYKGAVEDFEFFVNWTDDDEAKSRNQSYLNDLRNRKNPFTPKKLEEFRNRQNRSLKKLEEFWNRQNRAK
ncbi:MAG: CHAT domain-containing protein [Xenococcaceae cyanobacterium MO_188.B29]|nr:CHAT domain-containing protein [Xenococcaceae cyanobacterium MO_188.B29]